METSDREYSASRMVLPLGVFIDLRTIEVNFPQVARAVPFRLIVEVWRFRIAALATRRHGHRAHSFAEFDHGNEAVSAGAIPLFRPWVRARSERSESPPNR